MEMQTQEHGAEELTAVVDAEVDPRTLPDAERLERFGRELDRVRREAEARVGAEDVARVKKLRRLSLGLEVLGRGLLHVCFEPLGFTAGVASLWLHKQLEAIELGHTALHGAYDGLPGAEDFQSKSFRWEVPIDEESWRAGHNGKHHGHTNVAERDPDIHFGPVRLTEHTPWAPMHRFQLPFALLVLFPNFAFLMNFHFTGLNDVFTENGLPSRYDVLPDRSPESVRLAFRRALRKYGPYYLRNYVFFPALAGPFFWKVLLGNVLAETLRDVYSAATIFCGHVGEETASYAPEKRARTRGEWYAMQVEASNNFEVPAPFDVLCGGLELQIEHHLFPRLPPQRLREVAPEVRALCEKYGVRYRREPWGTVLRKALSHIARLGREAGPSPGAQLGAVARSMA